MNTTPITTGETPNFLKALAGSMAAMRAYSDMENALASGQLTSAQREQIALAVAEMNGSNECVNLHSALASHTGLSEADIRLARTAAAADAVSNAMLSFTLSVVLQRGEIKAQDLKALREAGFSESQIIEIVANIALNIFTNYLNLIARTEADFSPAQADGPFSRVNEKFAGRGL